MSSVNLPNSYEHLSSDLVEYRSTVAENVQTNQLIQAGIFTEKAKKNFTGDTRSERGEKDETGLRASI